MEKSSLLSRFSEIPLGTILIQYLGQAGFWFRGEHTSFLVDPYLSNYVVDSGIGDKDLFQRQFPPPVDPGELNGVEFVFITHAHADHCDPQTILPLAKGNPALQVICPVECIQILAEAGVKEAQIHSPTAQVWYRSGSLEYMVIPSAHYQREVDPQSGNDRYMGYVIRTNGVTLYHSGDTILYPGMIEALKRISLEYDIACLPVNGRDAQREEMGIIGNLDGREALELTLAISAQVLLPMHNDLFAVNHVDPGILASFADKNAPRQRIHWLQPGEIFWYVK